MRLVLVVAAALFAQNVQAEVMCPDSLDVQQQAVTPSEDWTVTYSEAPLRLTGVTVFDGPPSQNRKVKPYSAISKQGELRISWRLPESRRNFHLMCTYERTTANLVTVLPPGVNGCNVVIDRRVSYGREGNAVKRNVCN
ncbi:MAG TPA: STY0301 family protein [Burkholderiales bacterium]|nr:STY0301 family protein [Burkholderiales bacterium]